MQTPTPDGEEGTVCVCAGIRSFARGRKKSVSGSKTKDQERKCPPNGRCFSGKRDNDSTNGERDDDHSLPKTQDEWENVVQARNTNNGIDVMLDLRSSSRVTIRTHLSSNADATAYTQCYNGFPSLSFCCRRVIPLTVAGVTLHRIGSRT